MKLTMLMMVTIQSPVKATLIDIRESESHVPGEGNAQPRHAQVEARWRHLDSYQLARELEQRPGYR